MVLAPMEATIAIIRRRLPPPQQPAGVEHSRTIPYSGAVKPPAKTIVFTPAKPAADPDLAEAVDWKKIQAADIPRLPTMAYEVPEEHRDTLLYTTPGIPRVQTSQSRLELQQEPLEPLPIAGEKPKKGEKSKKGILKNGTLYAGQYRIRKFLGRGGMGTAYLASVGNDPRANVVIKIALEQDVAAPVPGERTRMGIGFCSRQEEAVYMLLADTGSDVFTRFYGAGVDEAGHHYMAMEYVAGKSLGAVLRGKEKLPIYRVIEIAMQLCGLQVLHDKGYIHRDIKPDNIILRRRSNEAVVLDLGTAAPINDPMFHQSFSGSPTYASPEQASLRVQDERSDIYSLGLLLRRMLTGENPMEASSAQKVLAKQASHEPVPDLPFSEFEARFKGAPISFAPLFSDLNWLIREMTEKKPGSRPRNLQIVQDKLVKMLPLAMELAQYENLKKQTA